VLSLLLLGVKKKSANFHTKIVIAQVLIIQYEQNLQQILLYKSFTHPTNFMALTIMLFGKNRFFVICDFVSSLSAVSVDA